MITITISHNGVTENLEFEEGTEIAEIRSQEDLLEEIGAPSTYTFSVNGMGVDDNYILQDGDKVTFRPKSGEKG